MVPQKRKAPLQGGDACICLEYDTDITEQKETSSRLEYLAKYDELLGLPKREKFMSDLARILKDEDANGAILLTDLDEFKNINDAFGHDYGDQLLKEMTSYVCCNLAPAVTIYRIGGDEAAFLLDGFPADKITGVVERLLSRFRMPWSLRGREEYCTLSLGVVRYPEHGTTVAELISKADIALYKAKKAGKNRAEWYVDDSETCSLATRVETERKMRRAVQRGCSDFHVFYQPIVDIKTGRRVGAEALIRWQNERGEFVNPGMFIPLAEYNGLIVPIGEHVLRLACAQCREWQRMGAKDFYVSVNISVRQLQISNLAENIVAALVDSDLSPKSLVLEVTESIAIKEMQRGVAQLRKLRELGIRIALDDFGTGYSSLNYLRELPLDIVKIDKSFVADILTDEYHQSFIRFVFELARGAGLRVCTEGIETRLQLKFIEALGGNLGQGYYFGRPIPAADFSKILRELGRI